jgi:hypothetical protein
MIEQVRILEKIEVLNNLGECVRFKTLWNKAWKLEIQIRELWEGNNVLMFESEKEETKREAYASVDCLKRFRENLNLKPKYQKILDKMGGEE